VPTGSTAASALAAPKYQYYQSLEYVNISVLIKNLTPDEVEIAIEVRVGVRD
jgi:hypothetical protein